MFCLAELAKKYFAFKKLLLETRSNNLNNMYRTLEFNKDLIVLAMENGKVAYATDIELL